MKVKKYISGRIVSIICLLVSGCIATLGQTAVTAKTQHIDTNGRTIAFRSVGKGAPIILCNRFRGVLDSWDPAFIDELAKTYQVVTFDYTGIGRSTGEMGTDVSYFAADVKDLAEGLRFKKVAVIGWSFGGIVAQAAAIEHPALVSRTVLIGTNPPGTNHFPAEQIFIETSSKVNNDLRDETILFFEPKSPASVRAAAASRDRISQRTADLSVPVPEKLWANYLQAAAGFSEDKNNYRVKLGELTARLLVVSGDHDIVCPIENWYALTRKLPNMQIIMLPDSGHGPQHQYPQLSVNYIKAFLGM